jgi:23S rRNA (cytidine1920-2'-O)/16S rRNA (cytidine1409-2'-O)-methyltransferase
MSRRRLDAELVRRGLARSREVAAQLIADGQVSINGQVAAKPATQVEASAPIVVRDAAATQYVSRGAHKLLGALDAFAPRGLVVADRRCLDAGASTGGFTDVLLRRGAREVVAVDVGYGQLAWSLRSDPRVVVVDRTNVRTLTIEQVGGPVDLVVADLSFISLTVVLPALTGVLTPHADADAVLMVKPQFEVGREALGSGGVVRDVGQRSAAVRKIASAAGALGLGVAGVTASPLPGPAGNVEYFLWLRAGAAPLDPADLQRAVEEGPQ